MNNRFAAAVLREEVVNYGVIGRRLSRTVEIAGMNNTAGEKEVYRVRYDGLYNDGSVRADVFVQRPNGEFAILNSGKHYQRISRVIRLAKELGAEADYRAANAAALA